MNWDGLHSVCRQHWLEWNFGWNELLPRSYILENLCLLCGALRIIMSPWSFSFQCLCRNKSTPLSEIKIHIGLVCIYLNLTQTPTLSPQAVNITQVADLVTTFVLWVKGAGCCWWNQTSCAGIQSQPHPISLKVCKFYNSEIICYFFHRKKEGGGCGETQPNPPMDFQKCLIQSVLFMIWSFITE